VLKRVKQWLARRGNAVHAVGTNRCVRGFAKAYGLAHRGLGIANTVDTRFAIASGTKGLTALTVAGPIEDGLLEYATTARSVLDGFPALSSPGEKFKDNNALFAGRVVARGSAGEMVRRRSETRDAVMPQGFDHGVSFRGVPDPVAGCTHTGASNTSHGTWPVTRHLDALVRP
jgi:hypothetical protein